MGWGGGGGGLFIQQKINVFSLLASLPAPLPSRLPPSILHLSWYPSVRPHSPPCSLLLACRCLAARRETIERSVTPFWSTANIAPRLRDNNGWRGVDAKRSEARCPSSTHFRLCLNPIRGKPESSSLLGGKSVDDEKKKMPSPPPQEGRNANSLKQMLVKSQEYVSYQLAIKRLNTSKTRGPFVERFCLRATHPQGVVLMLRL